ncbi:phosphotransferase family protein [Galbitalea soli]|uniref:Aminoglycoside phosphotransferase family protein n=1 Tax=Galbitalea soli TaxID=1268042 RepID=A0A7C9PKG9_9MICO|nr:aminoglycoside phosphotransferase family protein [Galbitalea soli]NEM89814.1 aminoglycoside phosphotransferase family protein [Galbitalea soli]NYJ30518.1 hypothetical protein [Galbitalea soli]
MTALTPPGPAAPEKHAPRVLTRLADTLGMQLLAWRTTVAEPTDAGFLQGYELEFRGRAGERIRQTVFVETSPSTPIRAGVLVLDDEPDATVAVWTYPHDPQLPALAELLDAERVVGVLARLGVDAQPMASTVVAYRPGKRAVVRLDTPQGRLYVKIVEDGKAPSIAERHALFRASAVPVPRVLGWSRDGLVALSELPGVEAQAALARIGDPERFLDQVEFLTTLIAGIPAINTARPSLLDRVDWYVDRLRERLPERADAVARVGDQIMRLRRRGREYAPDPVTIHGDLHLGQLFVDRTDPAQITGVLDIDTAGSGDPADDAAALYAHLVTLGVTSEQADAAYAAACFDLAARWLARWPRHRNAGFNARARAIAATHLLGHALRPATGDDDAIAPRLLAWAERLVAVG